MSTTYPALASGYELVIRDNEAVVRRLRDRVAVAALAPLEAVTVGLLDGQRSQSQLLEFMERVGGVLGQRVARQCLMRLDPLVAWLDHPTQRAMPALENLSGVAMPDRRSGLRTLPGPRVLHWWVTNACPRRCVYCFANPDHKGGHEPNLIERARLVAIFEEAASLGAQQLLVAGGEPLLRGDLPEVMGDAIACGIEPAVTTKFPISASYAERLAAAGMQHICLSIDSFDPKTNRALIGSATYAEQVERSIRSLRDVGVRFSFEFVATSANHHELEAVAARAAAEGARVLLVVPFEPVLNPIGGLSNALMALPDSAELDHRIAGLNQAYEGLTVEAFEEIGSDPNSPNCDIGKTKMLFDPFGRVHRCYKLLQDGALFGADLRCRSVAEAWHDPEFNANLLGERHRYAGTSCGSCGGFDACHDDGRCIFQSMMDHGDYFDKDRICHGPFPA